MGAGLVAEPVERSSEEKREALAPLSAFFSPYGLRKQAPGDKLARDGWRRGHMAPLPGEIASLLYTKGSKRDRPSNKS